MAVVPKSLIGLHELGGQYLFDGKRGWILLLQEIGRDPANTQGYDHRMLVNAGIGTIDRVVHGYGDAGTLPRARYYTEFSKRVGQFVAHSPGIQAIHIGNEPNHGAERPEGVPISVANYLDCFGQCYTEAKRRDPSVLVMPAPIAPWNNQTGDWLAYQRTILQTLQHENMLDGVVMHAYTHYHDPQLVTSDDRRHGWYWEFRTYIDQMANVPPNTPVFITEANPQAGWLDVNNGWVNEVYKEVVRWNSEHAERTIYCCCLYRWPLVYDQPQWAISTHPGVVADLQDAIRTGYVREEAEVPIVWSQVYQNKCERGFYDQDGIGELTIPNGTEVHWLQGIEHGVYHRPEMDAKDATRHPQVYEGRYSAAGSFVHATGSYGLVTEPIYIQPARLVRGSVMYMHEFSENGAGGARCGIVQGDGPFSEGGPAWPVSGENPFTDERIHWGAWRGTYNNGLPNCEWVQLETPQVLPTQGHIRLIVQFNADYAGVLSASHLDVFTVEQATLEDGGGPTGEGYEVDLRITGTIRPLGAGQVPA